MIPGAGPQPLPHPCHNLPLHKPWSAMFSTRLRLMTPKPTMPISYRYCGCMFVIILPPERFVNIGEIDFSSSFFLHWTSVPALIQEPWAYGYWIS